MAQLAVSYWLMKSEPGELSIYDLAKLPKKQVEWFGVRNYKARNYMWREMQVGDLAFFWHSSCKEPGIYGIVRIVSQAHPDSTQFIQESPYYEPKSVDRGMNALWWCVDVELVEIFHRPISIKELRSYMSLSSMQVLARGNRLSITPVARQEWQFISMIIKS